MKTGVVPLCLLTAFTPLLCSAGVIRVPADQPSIQAGIDAASDGDTVLVASGVYRGPDNREINFAGKAITVCSADGAEFCIIDCQSEGFGFIFQNGEGNASLLEGFTIREGIDRSDLERGGGVICFETSPTVRGNIFDGCGGMFFGAIHCIGASPVIDRNIIRNCETTAGGPGIACVSGSSPLITDNVVSGNHSRDGAVGLFIDERSSPTVINNLFHGNQCCYGSVIDIRDESAPVLINNTIAGNDHDSCENNGYVHLREGCTPLFVNCIVWDNSRSIDNQQGDPSFRYCDIRNMASMGPGCIDTDPRFITGPAGGYYLSQVAAGQEADSPCVDAGDPASSPPGGTTRTDDRPDTGVADMGFHYARFAVICDVDGSGRVDGIDLSIFSTAFGAEMGDERYRSVADFDRNGIIDGSDLAILSACFGSTV